MMTLRTTMLSIALVAVAAVPVQAQVCTAQPPPATPWTCSVNTSASLVIGDVLSLTLSSTTTALTPPSASDYDAGFVANTGPTAIVLGNRAWRLQMSAAAANWTASNTQPGVNARVNKPAADLLRAVAAGGPFTALSTTPATVASGNASAGTTTNFFFRTVYAWTLDTPGAYSLVVTFTLLAP
jgi:hypothetical protein